MSFCRWISSLKEYLVHFVGVVKRNWTVEILSGEFSKFQELSNFAEEQRSYGKYSSSASSEEIWP
jgi:hypothetical protein